MILIIVLCILGTNIPTASIHLKGFGAGCFPFFLDEQTGFLTYPATTDNSTSNFIGVGRYSDQNLVRCAIHTPRFSMVTFDFYSYHYPNWNFLDLRFKQAIGIKNFGVLYSAEYRKSILDTTFDWRQRLYVIKANYEGFENILLNIGVMSGKFRFDEYGDEDTPAWLIGPIVELRYDFVPFSIFANSRHPESLTEIWALPYYFQGHSGYNYNLFPFEVGFGYVDIFDETKMLVLGLRAEYIYEVSDSAATTIDMTTLGATFVSGCEIKFAEHLAIRGGFEIDCTSNMSDSTVLVMNYRYTLGGSLHIGDKFKLDIATKNLATLLDSDVIIKWHF